MATTARPLPNQASARERELIQFLERFWLEGQSAKDMTDLRDVEDHLQLVRGQQWPRMTPRSVPQFVLNLLNDHVQRKVGLLTDARPILEVTTTNDRYTDRTHILAKPLNAMWTETSWQEALAKGLALTLMAGSNVGMIGWDPLADNGRGDIRPRFFDPRSVAIDPGVTTATGLENAEYVVTREVRSVASLVEQFGERALLVQADANLANQFSDASQTRGMRGVSSPAAGLFRRRFHTPTATAVPRAHTRHYWFKDWQRDEHGQPQRFTKIAHTDGSSVLRPVRRLIRHAVVAGGVVLVDEPNPYWHQNYPIDILDWGMETDHLWGQSEIRQLRASQEALNRLTSQVLRNTTLLNNFVVSGDHNALDADQWNELTNRPAIILKQRPNTRLDFRSPPALPAYLFTLLEFLVKSLDMVGGMSEVGRGQAGGSQSGITVESLQLASQTVIRLQARRLEAFLTRMFSKAISLVFQFYTSDRVKQIVGDDGMVTTFAFDRAALVLGLQGKEVETAFRDFVLTVRPGSSLNATRIQKAVLASNLYGMGLLTGEDLLSSVEWPDPKGTFERAQSEHTQKAAAAAAASNGVSGSLNRAAGGARRIASFPAGPMGSSV